VHLGRSFGEALAHRRRQVNHLDALALQADLLQQFLRVFDSPPGVEITFQVMTIALQSPGCQHPIRAVLEGVTYSQKDCLVLIEGMGARVDKVRLSGGGAKSPFWRQMFADAFNKTIATLETQEGSAYGAGLLAMVGSGHFPSVEAACRAAVRETTTVTPDAATAAAYAGGYDIYTQLYPALQAIYPKL